MDKVPVCIQGQGVSLAAHFINILQKSGNTFQFWPGNLSLKKGLKAINFSWGCTCCTLTVKTCSNDILINLQKHTHIHHMCLHVHIRYMQKWKKTHTQKKYKHIPPNNTTISHFGREKKSPLDSKWKARKYSENNCPQANTPECPCAQRPYYLWYSCLHLVLCFPPLLKNGTWNYKVTAVILLITVLLTPQIDYIGFFFHHGSHSGQPSLHCICIFAMETQGLLSIWVHNVLKNQPLHGEFHRLIQELRFDDVWLATITTWSIGGRLSPAPAPLQQGLQPSSKHHYFFGCLCRQTGLHHKALGNCNN